MLPVTTTSSGNTYCHYNFKRKEAQAMVATVNRHSLEYPPMPRTALGMASSSHQVLLQRDNRPRRTNHRRPSTHPLSISPRQRLRLVSTTLRRRGTTVHPVRRRCRRQGRPRPLDR
jgi:hypothetical protein